MSELVWLGNWALFKCSSFYLSDFSSLLSLVVAPGNNDLVVFSDWHAAHAVFLSQFLGQWRTHDLPPGNKDTLRSFFVQLQGRKKTSDVVSCYPTKIVPDVRGSLEVASPVKRKQDKYLWSIDRLNYIINQRLTKTFVRTITTTLVTLVTIVTCSFCAKRRRKDSASSLFIGKNFAGKKKMSKF